LTDKLGFEAGELATVKQNGLLQGAKARVDALGLGRGKVGREGHERRRKSDGDVSEVGNRVLVGRP
jgi:hypothetical protein